MNVTFLGAGAWGSALAKLLHENGHTVTLWDHDPAQIEALRRGRCDRYLPGLDLPRDWTVEGHLARAADGADWLVFAVPSQALRTVATQVGRTTARVVSVTKGIEFETGDTMGQLLEECLPGTPVAALSGPSFAIEVARGIPTAVVCASRDAATAQAAQALVHRPTFRVYTSTDLLGVELGGALKNVMAIAAGVGDGLGFGDNTKAALVTRAVAEMRRLGVACGAQAETFAGLSGIGDLFLTCSSQLSRNRALGERLGRGEGIAAIMASGHRLAEGYPTARAAHRLARRLGIETPIIDQTYAMLYEDKNPRQAVLDLTGRETKAED